MATATQIYVVTSQPNYLMDTHAQPVQAFSDYPSALAYAKSIFTRRLGEEMSAKDLVFLINLQPAATTTASTTTPTTTA